MRVLIFLDTPRQSSYVASVEAALAKEPEARVMAGGPGVTPQYFGIAEDFGEDVIARGLIGPRASWMTSLRRALSKKKNTRPVPARSRVTSGLRLPFRVRNAIPPLLVQWSMMPLRLSRGLMTIITTLPGSDNIITQTIRRKAHITEARSMLLRAHPDVLVVMEDNAEGLTGVVTYAARRLGIPVVILPDYIPNPIEPAQYYFQSKSHLVRTNLDRLVAVARPKWVFEYNGKKMLRLSSSTIIAYHILGCDPPAPWILNAGYAAAIALDSDAMLMRYLELGFRRDALRVIGTAHDDKLHQSFISRTQIRSQVLLELGLTDDRPLIVCAIPPDQYSSSDTSRFEFSSYEHLLRAWLDYVAALAPLANVLVRLHPRTSRQLIEPLCPPGVHIMSTPTEELVPICDLYVASVSTTIRWALGLGIPVVNYDCYRYGYGDFSKAKGVVEVTDRPAFVAAIESILLDSVVRRDLEIAAFQDRVFWGNVDGRYSGRLAALLYEAGKSRQAAHATHTESFPSNKVLMRGLWSCCLGNGSVCVEPARSSISEPPDSHETPS